VSTLTEILEVNWIILYFVYGLVFFATGLVTALQWRRQSSLELARPLPWLAAFGITHGLNEWGYIFVPLQALYLDDTVVRLMIISHLLLLAASFFFLFQFGVELLLPLLSGHRLLRVLPGVMLLFWGAAVFLRGAIAQESIDQLVAIGDGWSRYLLAFPGALLSSIGLFRQARYMRLMELRRIATYLTGAAIAFLVYALVGGLIVPSAPVFPATFLNYDLLASTIQIPAPVFRSLCGLAMALFVTRSLEVFQVETDRRIAQMKRERILADDRERIGRELHDGIVQNIYAAGLGLQEAHHLAVEDPVGAQKQIRTVIEALDGTIHDIRRYIFDLQVAEQNRELETVLETLVRELRVETLLDVRLELKGTRCCWLDPEQVSQVTQIAREALSNVVQHAGASRVTVTLSYLGNATQLVVADNGKGMAQNVTAASHQGHGIANMRNRALMLGGDLTLKGEPGQGLRLELNIPCEKREDPELIETEVREQWVSEYSS
jgi:signal transduction histidine kinase